MKNKQQKNFFLSGGEGGTVYSLVAMVSLVVSLFYSILVLYVKSESKWQTYLGYFLPVVSLGLVTLYSIKNRNLDFVQGVALKKFEKKYILIALLICAGALFSLSWINEAFISLMEKFFSYKANPIVLPKENGLDFVLCTIFICALPAFFEEVVFRGILLNGCKRLGDLFAIIAVGILFSLYHKNPMQTVYQFVLGAIYALLVIKSGSIIPAIIMHFLNNFYIIVLYFLTSSDFTFSPTVNVILTVVGTICLIGGLAWLVLGCEKPLADEKLNEEYAKRIDVKQERKSFIIFSLMGVVVVLVLWISNLITFIG